MAQKGPGKHFRNGITLVEFMERFPDDKTAEKWFEAQRWPDGIFCPKCGSVNVQVGAKHKTMAHRCRDCRKFFSVKTGTVMESSNLGCRVWVLAMYLLQTGLKGQASLKLHRDLGITQKTAWHLAHRIRECWNGNRGMFSGPVEVDETYVGGRERNKHAHKKLNAGRGGVGKAIVIGARDRETNQVSATIIETPDAKTLHGFIKDHAAPDATVYTDDHSGYRGLPFKHEVVRHSVREYVKEQASTNGIESFWALLKRGYQGTYHHWSRQHLQRYINEFSGRRTTRDLDTINQLEHIVKRMEGKRLRYRDLVG